MFYNSQLLRNKLKLGRIPLLLIHVPVLTKPNPNHAHLNKLAIAPYWMTKSVVEASIAMAGIIPLHYRTQRIRKDMIQFAFAAVVTSCRGSIKFVFSNACLYASATHDPFSKGRSPMSFCHFVV